MYLSKKNRIIIYFNSLSGWNSRNVEAYPITNLYTIITEQGINDLFIDMIVSVIKCDIPMTEKKEPVIYLLAELSVCGYYNYTNNIFRMLIRPVSCFKIILC